MAIRIFVTGGTFDKEYNELKGELFFKDTRVLEMLKLGRCRIQFDITILMMIDSLNMKDSDGLFNLGTSLAFAQSLPHGIYIAMNGMYFNPNNVRKNKHFGIFEKIK